MTGNRTINIGNGNYNELICGNYIQGDYINLSQDLSQTAAQIQQLLTQLQTQGYSQEDAQQQTAQDLAKQAQSDPTVKSRLVKWGQSLGDTAAKTTVSAAAIAVFKLALRSLGLLVP